MAGTKIGGVKAAQVNKEKYGENFYHTIGAKGGSVKVPKGFAVNLDLASRAGAIGGAISKRRPKEVSNES